MDYKQKYMCWLEEMWDVHNNISREEKRKEEVLEIFKRLGKLAEHKAEAPNFPPWEPPR